MTAKVSEELPPVSARPGMVSARAFSRGFTLLEVLVALSIFAVLSALAYGGLRSVLETRQHTDARMDQLARVGTTFALLGRDIEQIIARGIRDEFGDRQPPLRGGMTSPAPLIEFTRSGWRNPARVRRSTLQRVAYRDDGSRLLRLTWSVLDRAQDSLATTAPLLESLEAIEVRYLDEDREWHEEWPPLSGAVRAAALPIAVEVTLKVEGWGALKRLFRVPQGRSEIGL